MRKALFVLVLLLLTPPAFCDFNFTPGDFYATTYFTKTIDQFSSNGTYKGSITLPSTYGYLHGIDFGSDGLLYATVASGFNYSVLAIDATGAIKQTYNGSGFIAGNLSYGSIASDQAGNFFIGSPNGVMRFTTGGPTIGQQIWQGDGVYSVDVLPNGNLLVATSYNIYETTNKGQLVRQIKLNDPNNMSPSHNPSFCDIRGVEYDPVSGSIFVTALGYTDFYYQLMKLEATTGILQKSTYFRYGSDMYLTNNGKLIVGSRTQKPGIFTTNLEQIGSLDASDRMFVTQYVPEPASVLVFITGFAGIFCKRIRSRCVK